MRAFREFACSAIELACLAAFVIAIPMGGIAWVG
jgi:hypothetical protein